MSYRFLLDKAQIFFDGQNYFIRMIKIVEPLTTEPVEFVYARVDVSITPEMPDITSEYYRHNPISLEALKFTPLLNRVHPLRFNILNQYTSNIEVAILMHRADADNPSPLRPGQTAVISHQIKASMRQWGNWLQREVRIPTERVSVSLIFPHGIVACRGVLIVGGSQRPLKGRLEMRTSCGFDHWYWKIESPTVHERYKFTWEFEDGREKIIKQDIVKRYSKYSSKFSLSEDGSQANWFGESIKFSTKQAMAIQYLWERNRADFAISEYELLEEIESKSGRIRDVFKNKVPLLQTLLKWSRGRVQLDISRQAFDAYIEKKRDASK